MDFRISWNRLKQEEPTSGQSFQRVALWWTKSCCVVQCICLKNLCLDRMFKPTNGMAKVHNWLWCQLMSAIWWIPPGQRHPRCIRVCIYIILYIHFGFVWNCLEYHSPWLVFPHHFHSFPRLEARGRWRKLAGEVESRANVNMGREGAGRHSWTTKIHQVWIWKRVVVKQECTYSA